MKQHLLFPLLLAVGITSFTVQAQAQAVVQSITIDKSNMGPDAVANPIPIDAMTFRCLYTYQWVRDTNDRQGSLQTDYLLLEIGQKTSKFYSYKTFQADSLRKTATPEEIMANPKAFLGGSKNVVYKHYPVGKETITDKILRSHFSYEEDLPSFAWTLCDSTRVLLGYSVQMATCSFRGRDYVAWFASEIAISDGPWKFQGLPGLILEVADTQGHYTFSATGIAPSQDVPIVFDEYPYLKTTRKKYTETRRRYVEDPIGFLTSTTDVKIAIRNDDGSENKSLSQSQPMKYDFLERDLRK